MTAALVCSLWSTTCSPAQLEVLDEILEVSHAENIDPLYVAAVAWAESRWHADRVSRCGARGPLGLLPVWLSRPICNASGERATLVGCGVRLLRAGVAKCRGLGLLALGWHHTGRCVVDGYARRVWRDFQRARAKAARKVKS
jgi:hypothetical protein